MKAGLRHNGCRQHASATRKAESMLCVLNMLQVVASAQKLRRPLDKFFSNQTAVAAASAAAAAAAGGDGLIASFANYMFPCHGGGWRPMAAEARTLAFLPPLLWHS